MYVRLVTKAAPKLELESNEDRSANIVISAESVPSCFLPDICHLFRLDLVLVRAFAAGIGPNMADVEGICIVHG